MSNVFGYSDDNKRYHTYSYYLKKRFGQKVFKVPLNVNMDCPNRDGTKGVGGCRFCSAEKSGDFAGDPSQSLKAQYDNMRQSLKGKWHNGLCIPYLQAGTNTYADVKTLHRIFYSALELENSVGLSIATRADCIDEEKCRLLHELSEKTYLTAELGLQTIHDSTAAAMNRCHTYEDFLKGFEMLKKYDINVCVHIIDGLPGESRQMMLETADAVGKLGVHAVKIHLLHVLKNTPLAQMYSKGEFKAMEREEYVNLVCGQLELLPPEVIIERLTGDGAGNELIAPIWSRDKRMVLNMIDMELARRNSYQGKNIKPE